MKTHFQKSLHGPHCSSLKSPYLRMCTTAATQEAPPKDQKPPSESSKEAPVDPKVEMFTKQIEDITKQREELNVGLFFVYFSMA
jgi:hypothetical protein